MLTCGESSIGSFALGAVAGLISYFVCCSYQGYTTTEITKQIESMTQRYGDANNAITYINTAYDVDFIPYDYRTETAMNFLYNMLASQRAFNLQLAINLYEEEKRRAEMVALYQAQVDMGRRQLQLMETHNRQMAAQIQQNALQNQPWHQIEEDVEDVEDMEEDTEEQNGGSFGLGKTLVVGGIIMAAIAMATKKEE